jgi:MOSC domain-containing protein YiiM
MMFGSRKSYFHIVSQDFIEPVNAPVIARTLNLDGDQQTDLTIHDGVDKAVYAYPSEDYSYWRTDLPGVLLRSGCHW